MLLTVLIILNVLLLGVLGWGLRKEEIEAQEEMQGWVAQPIPVRISQAAIVRSQVKLFVIKQIDRHTNPEGRVGKHAYVHP